LYERYYSFISNRPLRNQLASLIKLEGSFNTLLYNSGTAFFIDYGSWTDSSSIFLENTAMARIINSGQADLRVISIINKTSVLKGGAFLMNFKSILIVYDSIISNNLSLKHGGAVFMTMHQLSGFIILRL
jgi:hypothetical protein